MKPVYPPPLSPSGHMADRLVIREIKTPVASHPLSFRYAAAVQPGETFAAGARLGVLTYVLPPPHPLLATVVSGVLTRVTRKPPSQRPPQECTVTAPEDGVLTWHAPPESDLPAGEPVAAFIPLAAWQAYERLLSEHDRLFSRSTRGAPMAAAAAKPRDLSGKLDAMLARVSAISGESIRAEKSGMLAILIRQLRATLQAACPVRPEDLAPIYHRYFYHIETAGERLAALDAHYGALAGDPALSPEQAADIIRVWMDRKASVIRQITGEAEEAAQAEGQPGGQLP